MHAATALRPRPAHCERAALRGHGRGARRPSGFSLVEVLVALVVLAVGLLGTAALLLDSMSSSRNALERTHAVTLATDLAERIRANRDAGNAYDTRDGTVAPALDPACERADSGCSREAMAGHDLRRWLDAIEAQLPRGVGAVEVAPRAGGGLGYTITVAWAQSGSARPAAYSLVTEP
jgi:type IV pilus assembly protein PilV